MFLSGSSILYMLYACIRLRRKAKTKPLSLASKVFKTRPHEINRRRFFSDFFSDLRFFRTDFFPISAAAKTRTTKSFSRIVFVFFTNYSDTLLYIMLASSRVLLAPSCPSDPSLVSRCRSLIVGVIAFNSKPKQNYIFLQKFFFFKIIHLVFSRQYE